ncbi:hypothetical protein OG609_25965 [Streptomyces sp. NBC_01224]|uniref:hypothetical protein n=1 Tax=unclassified Streptomyces TaxID=2593676 RepID=UPI002E127549|nr:hypothetical protein OG609_25965 [Streptomyces sp. NBC_01224]
MTSPASAPTATVTPEVIKHLEFIQAIISRLSNGSFLIKGWTLTVAGVFFGVLVGRPGWPLASAGLIPIVGFWLLDSFFLRQERLFRRLYDDVRRPGTGVELFSMNVQPYHSAVPWFEVVRSYTVVNFYGMLALIDVVFIGWGVVRALTS